MIYSRYNQIIEKEAGFKDAYTSLLNEGVVALKLTVNVKTEEDSEGNILFGPVILEVTESLQHVFEDEFDHAQFLELGFWSKTFATPITGWRFRAVKSGDYRSGQTPVILPSLLDVVAYG